MILFICKGRENLTLVVDFSPVKVYCEAQNEYLYSAKKHVVIHQARVLKT